MAVERVQVRLLGHVPQLDCAVCTSGVQLARAILERKCSYDVPVPREAAQQLVRACIPQSHKLVSPTRCDEPTVGAGRHGEHLPTAPLGLPVRNHHSQLLTRLDVPLDDAAIF